MKKSMGLFWIAGSFYLFVSTVALGHPTEKIRIASKYDFETTISHLEQSVRSNQLFVVTKANGQAGAQSQGVTIPGNQVWGIFGPKYAVRMLKASVEGGFEAPIRLYIVEKPDKAVEVFYIKPTLVFRPYNNSELNKMAEELDKRFAKIVGVLQ